MVIGKCERNRCDGVLETAESSQDPAITAITPSLCRSMIRPKPARNQPRAVVNCQNSLPYRPARWCLALASSSASISLFYSASVQLLHRGWCIASSGCVVAKLLTPTDPPLAKCRSASPEAGRAIGIQRFRPAVRKAKSRGCLSDRARVADPPLSFISPTLTRFMTCYGILVRDETFFTRARDSSSLCPLDHIVQIVHQEAAFLLRRLRAARPVLQPRW